MDLKPKMVLAGGSGFFGKHLTDYFKNRYDVTILSRKATTFKDGVHYIVWDAENSGAWNDALEGADVLINLTGKSINCKFTAANKKELINSRVKSTQALGNAIMNLQHAPKIWINASAGAMYQPGNVPNTETDRIYQKGFLSEMAQKWEQAFYHFNLTNTRMISMRISLLLGKDGGVFPVWTTLAKCMLGGKAGDGRQFVSWMQIDDAVRAVDFLIQNELSGPVNFSAPKPCTNAELMKSVRSGIGVSFGIPAPAFGIKMMAPILGKEASLLLDSVYFVPEKLVLAGFNFTYKYIDQAVNHLVNGER